jgi:hypothetical protein
MKKSIALALCLLSSSAFAFINEVECTATQGTKEIFLEIERPFPSSSIFKQALITVTENGAEKEYNYAVVARRGGGINKLQYTGGGIRLEVDLWPDNSPRWGRNYRSTLISSDLGNSTISNVDCNFPNAF